MHASEENFEDGLHVVDQHLLEMDFSLRVFGVQFIALVPHFENDDLLDVPVPAFPLVVWERLWLFLLIFGNPVRSQRYRLIRILVKLTFPYFQQKLALDGSINILQIGAADLLKLLGRYLIHALGDRRQLAVVYFRCGIDCPGIVRIRLRVFVHSLIRFFVDKLLITW